jgi:hypothetical protein
MGDRKLTMFELHFDDGFQIGPRSLGGDEEEEPATADSDADVDEGSEASTGSRSLLATAAKVIAVLGVVALAARAAMRVAGPDEVPPIELDEAAEEVESPAD